MPNAQNFEQIVQDHQRLVFRTLLRLVGPEHLEDLAQDVFLRLFRALPNFRGDAEVATYLYRIAVNVAHNEWKRRQRFDRRHVSLSDEDLGLEDRLENSSANAIEQLEQSEFALLVEEHLQRLSMVERTVLVLYHQEERTYGQIAEVLEVPINTVRTHLHRARKKLREAIRASALSATAPTVTVRTAPATAPAVTARMDTARTAAARIAHPRTASARSSNGPTP